MHPFNGMTKGPIYMHGCRQMRYNSHMLGKQDWEMWECSLNDDEGSDDAGKPTHLMVTM